MARGVAIPGLRERLFLALERLWDRDGPAGLSTRALTSEAGCAKGVLHNHFGDLDGFLVEYVLARFADALSDLQALPARAGQGDVRDNLSEAAGRLFTHPVLVAHSIVALRPSVVTRLHDVRRRGPATASASLTDVEGILASYLEAEKDLGRVHPGCDTSAVALAIVATVHHLLLLHRPDAATARAKLGRVLATIWLLAQQHDHMDDFV